MNKATFKNKINSILKDNAIERFVSGYKKGKIDYKKLYKISNSQKVFKQKLETKGKDYSITFLLDASASMNGNLKTVSTACFSIYQQLELLKIPTSIYSFSTLTFILKSFKEKITKEKLCNTYSENYTIHHCWNCDSSKGIRLLEKGMSDVCRECTADFYTTNGRNSTVDSLALHIVGNEICKTNKKNILVVFTDGEGAKYQKTDKNMIAGVKLGDIPNAETVLNKLQKEYNDLIVLCISLNSKQAIKVYGKQNTILINSAEETFGAFIKLILKQIKRI